MESSKHKNFDSVHSNISPKIEIFNGSLPNSSPTSDLPRPKKKKRWKLWVSIFLILLALSGGGLLWFGKNLAGQSFVGTPLGWIASAKDLIMGGLGQAPLEGEESGWVNFLLLGIGGAGHDGPYLSDTIIVAQLKLETGQVVLSSIPRDYQVNLGKAGYRKINAAFAEGFAKNKDWNEAGQSARSAVESVSGLTIPYFAVIDFNGFEKAVNELGGITVDVPTGFTDYQYPDENEGYLAPQTFKAGIQTMDGKRALIYARSRHASGSQGSDFARSQRQQLVIGAIRDKARELNLVSDSGTITRLLRTFSENFHTNLTPGQILRLAKIAQEENFQITSANLSPETGLICPYITEDTGAYVLIPCPGKSKQDVMDFFSSALAISLVTKEKSVVWIATKNPNSGTYRRLAAYLEQAGLTVWSLNYTDVEPTESVIFAVNEKPATKEFLLETLAGREVSLAPPNIKIDATRSDIIVILGTSLPEKFTKPVTAPKIEAPAPSSQNTTTNNTTKDSTEAVDPEPKPTETENLPPTTNTSENAQ